MTTSQRPCDRWMMYAVLLVTLANTSEVRAVPGSIVNFWDPDTDQYIGSPSIEILPNGDYIATHAGFGPAHTALITYIYRSTDKGDTWQPYGNNPINENRLPGQTESSLFAVGNDLYTFGISSNVAGNPPGDWLSIRKSTDGGLSWTEPNSPTNGRLSILSSGVGYGGDAAPVTVHNGRVWRTFEEIAIPGGPGSELYTSFVMSAPANSDLLNAANWTRSTGVSINQGINPGWGLTEGNIVAKPNGDLVNMTRIIGANEKASMISVAANGTTSSFNQVTGIVPFQGGGTKFEVRYDPTTKKYWTLANDQNPPSNNRSILNLNSSADLVNWTTEGTILQDSNVEKVGFQYVDWDFDGRDIVAAIRTAYSGADNYHDANYLTFRRIRNYAATSSVQSVTLDVAEDTEITNWVNWSGSPRGELTPSDPPGYFGGVLRVADDNFPNGLYAGTGNDGWVMMRWDLSTLGTSDNSKLINNVDLRMIQLDGGVGEVEVYRINSEPIGSAWTESTVSWDSWVGATVGDEDITLLGTMTNTSHAGTKDGITHFSDSDLRTLVQEWLDGSRENLGILLKWPTSDPTNGDTYASRESLTDDPPQLIIDFIDLQSADFDRDLDVDGRDFLTWQRRFNQFPLANAGKSDGDANGDGLVNNADLVLWQSQYGSPLPLSALSDTISVPEPSAGLLLVLTSFALLSVNRQVMVVR